MTEKSLNAREAADHLHDYPDEFLTIPWGLRAYVHALVDHARATTPDDDRGRELASLRKAANALDSADLDETISEYAADIAVVTAHVDRLAAPAETEAGEVAANEDDSREAIDHPCAECVPCGPGCAGHWTVPDRCQPAASPPTPGEGQGATEGGEQ